MRRIILLLALALVAAGLTGCAFQNGPGDAVVVPPAPAVEEQTGTWYYVPCITLTGCDLRGIHYGYLELVPLPAAAALPGQAFDGA